MKNIFLTLLVFLPLLISCREDIVEFHDIKQDSGSIYLSSIPTGARIFFHDGSRSELQTPEEFEQLEPGDYIFTLKLDGYEDTTIVVKAEVGLNKVLNVYLKKIRLF